MLKWVLDSVVGGFFNVTTDILQAALSLILKILPKSPFQEFINLTNANDVLGYFNYFVPVGEMIAIGQAWLSCVGIYYAYVLILRWAKAIE